MQGLGLAALGRSLLFAVVFLVAVLLGRTTVMDGTSLSLVWPAAGVAVVWFTAQRQAGTHVMDLVLLGVITFVVNASTGASMPLAACFVAANVAQVEVFLLLFTRLCPDLWGAGGDRPLARLSQLWRLLTAACLSTTVGALIGPTSVGLLTGHWSWVTAAVWVTRNTASVTLIGLVGLRVGYQLTQARRTRTRSTTRQCARLGSLRLRSDEVRGWLLGARGAELLAVLLASVVAYTLLFYVLDGLPVAFPLTMLTVWVGLRFSTSLVALHDLLVGVVAVLFTLSGNGPFATIASDSVRALVVQAFVCLTAIVGLALALGRDERAELVSELREREAEAAAQARLMAKIVDAMSDGLTVFGSEGQVLMRNDAAQRLLGPAPAGGAVSSPSEHYGTFHPDGTPMPEEQLPYRRALSGEDVQADLLLRNGSAPQGRLLSLTASPLQLDDDSPAAVVLFHDVTAERRDREELASFAGVVAHDLLNPLTVIDGWAQVLHEDLAASGGTEGILGSVARIRRASGRMRTLIDDLLAWTTAGERTLVRAPVDLETLARDVVAARTEHAAYASGGPAPQVHVGHLPRVSGDPALLRQLLDNLVGNAVKYTAPESAPVLEITATTTDDRVEVVVADRGIGIPDGQHEAVFGTFARAHAGSGYGGTGLGLAICRRIAERHDGTIHAERNPGGGTRMLVTLQAAEAELSVEVQLSLARR